MATAKKDFATASKQGLSVRNGARPKARGDALLIVDVQKGFINEATDHIPSMVQKLQMEYGVVYATRFYNEEGSPYRTLIKWDKVSMNSPEFDFAFEVGEHVSVIDKNVYSCINEEFLRALRKAGAQVIDICGLETDICVTKCAVDLFENNFIPRVLAEFCASRLGADAHQNALATLARYIGKDQIIQ